jgi:hypothetical protein
VRGIIARALLVLTLSAAVLACDRTGSALDSAAQAESGQASPALRAALAARTIYPAKREEWRADITTDTDSTMVPLVFRASATTVALLQASPLRVSLFELNRRGLLLATRPARIDSVLNAAVPRDLVAPTELSRITNDGQVDVIDSATSTLVRESIGGYMFRRELPLLRGGSGRLCTLSPATLLHVRALGPRRTLEAFTLTAKPSDDALVGRHRLTVTPSSRLRFGNGDARRCLLLTEREVLVVTAPADPRAGVSPLLAPLPAPGDSAPPRTIERYGDASDSTRVLQPFVVDAAIVDGGFVVLVGIESDRRGRIIDYYNERGVYLQSAMLPFTASAMTGAGPRFLALHQDERFRWWLSSWLTPMAARGATAPPPIDDAPERQLFERPARTRTP